MDMDVHAVLKALVAAQVEIATAIITMLDCIRRQEGLDAAAKARMIENVCLLGKQLPRLDEVKEMLDAAGEEDS